MRGKKDTKVYIGVGSNLGDRGANIKKALQLVELIKGANLRRVSSIYETKPVGGPKQGNFLNGVFEITTKLDPLSLLSQLQAIEKVLGRRRCVKNGPRLIDLDILLFGKREIKSKELNIPHPQMHKREFVLRGLRELWR